MAAAPPTGGAPNAGPPVVMDALELLGLADGQPAEDTGEEEVFACNNMGATDDDRLFDSIIGAIEDAMIQPAFQQLLPAAIAACPELEILNEHDRFLQYKAYLAQAEAFLDAHVQAALPHIPPPKLLDVVSSRPAEVTGDVVDLVNGECVTWQSFEALWKAREAKAAA